MIITKLRLQEEYPMTGTVMSYPLPICDLNLDSSAGENGYILKEVQGLDPPDLVAVVDGFDISGIPIMSSVPDQRIMIFSIGFSPGLGQSYSLLRDNLYKLIDRTVLVSLMNGSLIVAQTFGYIQQFESVHFSNLPEVQITIECQDGEFSAPISESIPFIDLDKEQPIINYNLGTAPTGLDLQFKCTSATGKSGLTISNYSKFWYIGSTNVNNQFHINYQFNVNDIITISTQSKNKRITLLRNSQTYDLAGYINGGAVWPKLYPNVNVFNWDIESSWMEWISASYIPKYWGV